MEKTVDWCRTWKMEINPAKCGLVIPEESEEFELSVEGCKIPVVENYNYLGTRAGRGDLRAARNNADRVKGNLVLRENAKVLANPYIPLLHKALVIRGIVLPSLLYGKEVSGCTFASLKEAQRIANRAMMATGRGVSLAAARRELGIPHLRALVGNTQLRALREFPKKKTIIRDLLKTKGVGRNTWRNKTLRETKRLLKETNPVVDTKSHVESLWLQEDKKDTSEAFRRYKRLEISSPGASIIG
ncbi:MAG: uncharacterized protein A8A55_3400, partial [Amphiamblys sp. WSBS2006]